MSSTTTRSMSIVHKISNVGKNDGTTNDKS